MVERIPVELWFKWEFGEVDYLRLDPALFFRNGSLYIYERNVHTCTIPPVIQDSIFSFFETGETRRQNGKT